MKKIHYLLCIAVLNLLLAGCSIEKRHYTSGYHVEWNGHKKGKEIVKPTEQEDRMAEATPIAKDKVSESKNSNVYEKDQALPENSGEVLSASVDKEPEMKSKERFTSEKTSSVVSENASYNENTVVHQPATDDTKVSDQHSSDPSDSDLLLILLCLILPPLAVYLYFDQVNTTFWVSLILTLLFWIPGIIFAFLVCFGGVEL